MGTTGWVLGAIAIAVLVLGVVTYRSGRRNDDRQTMAILSLILGADLLVFAVDIALV